MEAKTPSTDPYKKTCKYSVCKKAFIARRLNMEYCSADCKKKENNGRAGELRQLIKKIDAQHKLNRKILEAFFNSGKTEISLDELRANKFDHSKPTGLKEDRLNNRLIPEFYNYALEEQANKKLKICKLW